MGRRIKIFIILVVVSFILILSACENTLLEVIETRIEAVDQINIDFTYISQYPLNSEMPIYFRFYPAPFKDDPETGETITDIKVIKSGNFTIEKEQLSESPSGSYFVRIVHDLNNDGDYHDDPSAFYVYNGTTNITYDISSYITVTDSPDEIDISEEAKMSIGNSYSIQYTDEGSTDDDAYEADDQYAAVSNTLTLGQGQIHTLGYEDKDYMKLIVTDWEYYQVEVTNINGNSPEIQLSVYQLEGDGTLSHHGSYYTESDGGYPAKVKNVHLGPGITYYVYVTATDGMMGSYSVNYNFQPEVEDAYENGSNDDTEDDAINPELVFGRTYQDHTIHDTDDSIDWADYVKYTLDYVGLDSYALEIVPPIGYVRPMIFEGVGRLSAVITSTNTTYGGFVEMFDGYPRLYLNARCGGAKGKVDSDGPTVFTSGAEYTSGPRGKYRMRLVAGPDIYDISDLDQDHINDYDDDTLAESSANGVPSVSVPFQDHWRSIYPQDDIDFIKFYIGDTNTHSIHVRSGSVDGIKTTFDIYNSDGTKIAGTYGESDGDTTISYSFTSTGYYYIRVERASWEDNNQETGGYLVDIN